MGSRSISENGFTSFTFKPIKDGCGKEFQFKLTVQGGKIGVSYDRSLVTKRLDLAYDNLPLKGSVGFRALRKAGGKSPYDVWTLKNEPVPSEIEGYRIDNEEVKYIRDRWGRIIDAGDPYYNPNLTLSREDFSIKIES